MNRFRLQAYQQEFPFLKEIIGDTIPGWIKIARVDERLLGFVPRHEIKKIGLGKIEKEDRVFFVLTNGTLIADAAKQAGKLIINMVPHEEWEEETVLDGIYRLEVAETLQYIVIVTSARSEWDKILNTNDIEVAIYKPAKDITFAAEIAAVKAKVLEEIRAEANF